MKADRLGFWSVNILVSLSYTILLMLVLNPPTLVLVLFYVWMFTTRAAKARAREINKRVMLNTYMLAELLKKQDKNFNLDDCLEDFGIEENDD
jgi:hypothetical protein